MDSSGHGALGTLVVETPLPRSCGLADWAPGTTQPFYVYHQMATGELYQIKCNAPTVAARGRPLGACPQGGGGGVGGRGGGSSGCVAVGIGDGQVPVQHRALAVLHGGFCGCRHPAPRY